MKELKTKFYDFIIAAAEKNGSTSRKKLLSSYVSLFLIFSILMVTTFAWFTSSDNAVISSDTFTMESGTNMRVNEGEEISNHIILDNVVLGEASSIDGRNVYFPTTDTFSSNTGNMKFREATIGDQNFNYIYKNFKLRADSEKTNIYVKGYSIKVGDTDYNGSTEIKYDNNGAPTEIVRKEECPVRIAFITDSQLDPTVIEPDALIDQYVKKYVAVSSTNSSGAPTTGISTANPFSPYYMLGTPLFSIEKHTDLDVTMVVWLEGGANEETGNSVCDRYAGLPISIDIEIESNFDGDETITFIDDTVGDSDPNDGSSKHWITDAANPCVITMTYLDTDLSGSTQSKSIVMKQVADQNGCHAWQAVIPKSVVTDITFARYSVNDEIIFNAWYTSENISKLSGNSNFNEPGPKAMMSQYGMSLQTTRETISGSRYLTYTAKAGNGRGDTRASYNRGEITLEDEKKFRLAPCVGYWGINFGESSGGTGGNNNNTQQGGATSDSKCNLTIIIQDEGNKVLNDYRYNGAKLYAVFNDNSKFEIKSLDGDRPFGTGSVSYSSILTRIEMQHSNGTVKYFLLSDPWVVRSQQSYTLTCTIGGNESVSHN